MFERYCWCRDRLRWRWSGRRLRPGSRVDSVYQLFQTPADSQDKLGLVACDRVSWATIPLETSESKRPELFFRPDSRACSICWLVTNPPSRSTCPTLSSNDVAVLLTISTVG